MNEDHIKSQLLRYLTRIISETNGVGLNDTLELLRNWLDIENNEVVLKLVEEFIELLGNYNLGKTTIDPLMKHAVADAFYMFFKNFPLKYQEEHIHLTGSLTSKFVFPRIKTLLEGQNKKVYREKIAEVYGEDAIPIESEKDVDNLIRLKDHEQFDKYLQILYLPKLVLVDRMAHKEAAFHMSKSLYENYNVGLIRLKFTLSRSSQDSKEIIPGVESISPEDVVLGLYEGFNSFRTQNPDFKFILSPSFRKEASFFDATKFPSRKEDFESQVTSILSLIDKHPFLADHLCEIDTVGNEKDLYRKQHFNEFRTGLRKLQSRGFKIRSHHGETWHTLKRGIQAVDNAMNIWRIDALEHGLSLGINPNYYFHRLFQRTINWNRGRQKIQSNTVEYNELTEMDWRDREDVLKKLVNGIPLKQDEIVIFIKTKFHTAREIEHYQHDILNRMIWKDVPLTTLPSSNKRLTDAFEDYRDHPFSWWEKKGLGLRVGTDNYVTLNTDYIKEMLILLFSDPEDLKITKLLMVTTNENRRHYLSQLLWNMRKKFAPV